MKLSIKIILPIILISAMLILLSGCFGTVPDDNDSPGFTPGSITGIIMVPVDCTECQDSDCILRSNSEVPWVPVEGAIVTVIPHATLTDKDGYYTLGNIEPGVYYVITATYGNLVLKDIVEPPGVKAGEAYGAGTANCESTALGLIVEALLDMGLDTEDIELALEIIKENPKFNDLVDIICCIIEDCDNVTLICGVDELVQDIIDDEPGYTCPPLYQNQSLAIAINNANPCSDVCATISSITVSYTDGPNPDFMIIITPSYNGKGLTWSYDDTAISFNPANGKVCLGGGDVDIPYTITFTYTDPCGTSISGTITVNFKLCDDEPGFTCPPFDESLAIAIDNTNPCSTDCATINPITVSYTDGTANKVITPSYNNKGLSWVTDSGITFNPANGEVCLDDGDLGTDYHVNFTYTDDCEETATGTATVNFENCTTLDYITVETDPSPMNLCAAGTGTTETETGTIVTTAHYSDGSSMVVTPDSYVIGNINIVASVSGAGLVTSGSTVGSTTITVYYEGETATVTVTVTDCTTLDYITVETDPSPMNLCAAGTGTTETETGTIVTTAHYSDGSSMVVTPDSYVIGNINIVASVSGAGLVTSGSTVGSTTITVYYEGETATVTVTVTDCTTLESVEIVDFFPDPMDLCLSGTGSPDSGTITTMAYYSVGAPVNISTLATYTAVPTGVVSISGNVVTSIGLGTTTITATYEGKTAPTTVTVNVTDCTTLESIEIVDFFPDPMDLCLSGTGSPDSGTITTMAYYSVGAPVNISTLATYTAVPTGVVSISGNVVTSIGLGSTTITATYQGETAPTTVTVNVTDCTPPCISTDLSSFSLEIKEGSSWNEYLGSFSPSVKTYSVMATKNASHFRFTVDAECEGDATLYYNWYRGAQCGDSWLTGESGYSDPPSTWIPITSGGTYPTNTSDRPVCNKGGNVLFVKVTNAGSTEIYKVYVDRPNP